MFEVLSKFTPISLKEMDNVKLMNRIDTKFIISVKNLPDILESVIENYNILEINGLRNMDYYSQYFDTPDFDMYNKHQNKRMNRFKIRARKYINTNDNFLEIKNKSYKGRTIKTRIKLVNDNYIFEKDEIDFLNNSTPYNYDGIEKKMENLFKRITLVHKTANERITIDNSIIFKYHDKTSNYLENLIIIEAKQKKFNIYSDFLKILKLNGIRPLGFSKYCVGTYLLNPYLKSNNLKPKILQLNKILTN